KNEESFGKSNRTVRSRVAGKSSIRVAFLTQRRKAAIAREGYFTRLIQDNDRMQLWSSPFSLLSSRGLWASDRSNLLLLLKETVAKDEDYSTRDYSFPLSFLEEGGFGSFLGQRRKVFNYSIRLLLVRVCNSDR